MKAHANLIVTLLIATSFCLPLRLLASEGPLYLKRKERLEAEEKVKDARKALTNPNMTPEEREKLIRETYIEAHRVRVTKETLAAKAPEKEKKWRDEQLQQALLQSAFLKGGLIYAGHDPEKIIQQHMGAGQTISAVEAAEVIQHTLNQHTSLASDQPVIVALQTTATTSTISVPSTTTTTITTTTITATTATQEQQAVAKKTGTDKQTCIIL